MEIKCFLFVCVFKYTFKQKQWYHDRLTGSNIVTHFCMMRIRCRFEETGEDVGQGKWESE